MYCNQNARAEWTHRLVINTWLWSRLSPFYFGATVDQVTQKSQSDPYLGKHLWTYISMDYNIYIWIYRDIIISMDIYMLYEIICRKKNIYKIYLCILQTFWTFRSLLQEILRLQNIGLLACEIVVSLHIVDSVETQANPFMKTHGRNGNRFAKSQLPSCHEHHKYFIRSYFQQVRVQCGPSFLHLETFLQVCTIIQFIFMYLFQLSAKYKLIK